MNDLAALRQFYADELRAVAHLQSDALVHAFATVHREDFLGPGPWQIMVNDSTYRTTEDTDPRHLYHNVLVAIDETRGLNNGQPSSLAGWFEQLGPHEGERVVDVGCGTGYYTAILAEIVGPTGHVTAYEIDKELARRAGSNLAPWSYVEVVAGDGTQHGVAADAIFVNAGATHPSVGLLDSLTPGGRLLVPLTTSVETLNAGYGLMLKVVREAAGLGAAFVSPVGIFPCIGNRDARLNESLKAALEGDSWKRVRSVRLDAHEPSPECWLHGTGVCVSTLPAA